MKSFPRVLLAGFLILVSYTSSTAAEGKIRIGVERFDSQTKEVSGEQAGMLSDMLGRALAASKSFDVIQKDSVSEEQWKSLRYCVSGCAANLRRSTSSGALGAGMVFGTEKAVIKIDVRVIDFETSDVVAAIAEEGSAANSITSVQSGRTNLVSAEKGDLISDASADAVWRIAHRIREEIGGEYSSVVYEKDGVFTIDAGSSHGVRPGALYLVYSEGKGTFSANGDLILREKIPLAVLKVTDTDTGSSVCKVLPPSHGSVILAGDRITPISPDDAKGLAGKKLFPETRPDSANPPDAR
jgi:hypothetical protein